MTRVTRAPRPAHPCLAPEGQAEGDELELAADRDRGDHEAADEHQDRGDVLGRARRGRAGDERIRLADAVDADQLRMTRVRRRIDVAHVLPLAVGLHPEDPEVPAVDGHLGAGRHAVEVALHADLRILGEGRQGRLGGEHLDGRLDEQELPGEHVSGRPDHDGRGLRRRDVVGGAELAHCGAERRRGLAGRNRLGLGSRHGACAHAGTRPGQAIRLARTVLVAHGDRMDLVHHERLVAQVGHGQIVARGDAVGDELAIPAVFGRMMSLGADVHGLLGRLERAGVHAVIRQAVQRDPGLAGGLVELPDVGRHDDDDVGGDAPLRVGDADGAGEGGGHEGQGQDDGQADAIERGHDARCLL